MKYNNVYTLEEENSHRFYQLPKELFVNEKYKKLNSDAKILYALLLDRKELSRSNNWVDENNQVYLIYTRENIANMLGVSKPTAIKAFKQLKEANLIIEERQGLNKPNKIYVCRLEYSGINGSKDSLPQEVNKVNSNDTDINETDIKRYTITTNDAFVFHYYSFKYTQQYNKNHPTVTHEQLERMSETVNMFISDYDIQEEEWKRAVDEHFYMLERNNKNNGNILGFINGDDMQGSLVRYLEIK